MWKPIGSEQKQCLEARRLPIYAEQYPAEIDEEAAYAAQDELQMSVDLAPCDARKPLQLWRQDANGRVTSMAEVHCLALTEPVTNSAAGIANLNTTLGCGAGIPSAATQWRYDGGKLINSAYPRSALTHTAGEGAALFPIENKPVLWQQWVWY
ncbi:ricin-type beta-trefoil lectin domain protein [Chitinimonas sp. BJB300]|uniref:ricin-type beta-trefoil lectin domain protein n=1 Tax=Chitinimonas sp. BJB300 TaxID=1559339 RepID=UPI00117DC4AB|nr:ricin-type beta-trefoil lectin domain protein [Chitinimonas sp. BJB300]